MTHTGQKKPFELGLTLGDDRSGKKLAHILCDIELKPEKIEQLKRTMNINEDIEDDLCFRFQFTTQQGREKDVVQYFQTGLDCDDQKQKTKNLSLLQRILRRPKKAGKLEIIEQANKVVLYFRIYKQQMEESGEGDLFVLLSKIQKSTFKADLRLEATMIGHIENYKKNHIKIKVDCLDVMLSSNQFKMKHFQNMLQLIELFGSMEEQQQQVLALINNPIYKFFQNAQEFQVHLKLAAPRKFLQLFESGITQDKKQNRKKDKPQILKGLFKDEIGMTAIIGQHLALQTIIKYDSEAYLMRMISAIKKYYHYIEL